MEVEAVFMFCYILPNSANGLGGVWWNMVEVEYGGGRGGFYVLLHSAKFCQILLMG